MKLLYTAPELEIVRFRLTSDVLDSSLETNIPVIPVSSVGGDDDDDGDLDWGDLTP